LAVRIQFRRDTAANWTSVNPLLAQGEIGLETDTVRLKFGNGINDWNSLPYYSTASNDGDIQNIVNANYDMLATDYWIKVTTGASDRYIKRPPPTSGKKILLMKIDDGVGKVISIPFDTDKSNGVDNQEVAYQGGFLEMAADGTDYFIKGIGQ